MERKTAKFGTTLTKNWPDDWSQVAWPELRARALIPSCILVHLLFRLAPIAVRLIWLLLNEDLAELATTKATLGATQVTALLPLDL